MSGIEEQRFQHVFGNGQRLMIIELRKYKEIGALLIETDTTGSHEHICYQDRVQRASVSKVAVHMRKYRMEVQI